VSKKPDAANIERTVKWAEAERAGGRTLASICAELGISSSTYRRWRSKYHAAPDELPTLAEIGAQLHRELLSRLPRFAKARQLFKLMRCVQWTRASVQQHLAAALDKIERTLLTVPRTSERRAAHPTERCQEVIEAAAIKAATVSGGLSFPLGPLPVLTIIPDLIVIWKIQAQMVADIAAICGKKGCLSEDHLRYCLFKHAATQVARDFLVRVGDRMLLRRGPLHLLKRFVGRLTIPIAGALGVATYAYIDTINVGRTAMELFADSSQLPRKTNTRDVSQRRRAKSAPKK
jgi:uncharacterized protein (DUF697 family)